MTMHMPLESTQAARQPTRGELLLLGALTAFAAMTIDLYLPSMPAIAVDFRVSPADVQLTFTAFFIGMAMGQLVYGPVSDRIGRRPTILFGCGLYVLASIACTLAPSIGWLVAGRFVQALGCCAGMVVARAVVRDRYDHRDSARIFSILVLVLAVAPLVAPSLGAWLAGMFGWRSVFLALALFGAAVLAAVALRLDESRTAATAAKAASERWWQSYGGLVRERRLLGYILVGGANGATLFGYLATAADLMIDVWGFSAIGFALVFAGIAAGVIGASQINRVLLKRMSPDEVLAAAVLAAPLTALLLLGLAMGGAGPSWVIGGFFLVLTSNGFVAANALAGALNVDPVRAGATSGLYGAGNFACGALASAVAASLHDGTPLPVALVMTVALLGAALAYFGLARPPLKAAAR